MRRSVKSNGQTQPIYTLSDHPLVPKGCRLTVKLYGSHCVVSLIHPGGACPVQAQEVLTNLESRLLLVLLAFPTGCASAVLLAVLRLSQQNWHSLCEELLAQLAGTHACAGENSSWERVCIESALLSEAASREEECRSLWDALTTLRRKLRPFALLIPTYVQHTGYRMVALHINLDDHERARGAPAAGHHPQPGRELR